MTKLKIEDLPEAVASLTNKIVQLQKTVNTTVLTQPRIDRYPIGINEASKFLGLTKNTIYQYCNRNEIPHYKLGKKLFFFRIELIDLIKKHKILTKSEVTESIK
ncbi:helix-turn-helix domain-containing protein [Wenyingzhuangia sp. IMCC45533]